MTLQNEQTPPAQTTSKQSQAYAILRHVVTALGTAFTIFGALGLISQDDAQKLLNYIHQISDSLQTIWTAVAGIMVIVGPVIVSLSGKFAATAASLPGQLKSITSNKDVHIPAGSKIVVPESVAVQVPSPQVVGPLQGGGRVPPGAQS